MKINIGQRKISIVYFGLILAIWLIQVALTFQAWSLYRYEDGGQNATAVYYFANREVAIISSTYFAWYAMLHFVYSIFGFSIDTAHYVRLAIHMLTLLSVGILLKKYLGYYRSIIPMIAIGLSPTLTYFVTSSAQYGLELQLLPICLLLVDILNFRKRLLSVTIEITFWTLAMFGLLTYATFTFFLPAFAILYLKKILGITKIGLWLQATLHCLVSSTAFFVPLLAGFLYFKNPKELIDSPATNVGGLFKSGSILVFDKETFFSGIKGAFDDLFNHGYSYYYQLQNGEFSHLFPILTLLLVLGLSIIWFARNQSALKKVRWLLTVIYITILLNILIANLGLDPSGLPGIRRNIVTLAAFYVLFTLSWNRIMSYSPNLGKYVALGILVLLPFHHLLVLPDNYHHLKDPSVFGDDKRFTKDGTTPHKYFRDKLAILTKSDLYLDCREAYNTKTEGCSYQNIFTTLAASCLYNKLNCRNIYAYDPILDIFLPLTFESLKESTNLH